MSYNRVHCVFLLGIHCSRVCRQINLPYDKLLTVYDASGTKIYGTEIYGTEIYRADYLFLFI